MRRYTFPKSERLLKRGEFLRVYENGKKALGRFLTIYFLTGQAERKIGITIPGKLGGAVQRNRIKRLIKEAYRLNKDLLGGNTHLVITARPEAKGTRYRHIEQDFVQIVNKSL